MPAARQRPLEDSRSETSSTITNLKERTAILQSSNTAYAKGKRNVSSALNGTNAVAKPLANGIAAAPAELDPNLPRTDWLTFPPQDLHTYRQAYHFHTPSAYTNPHADLIYRSSRVAKRAPSAVYARRKLRDLKHENRKSTHTKRKEKEKATHTIATEPSPPSSQPTESHPATIRQSTPALATALRKHFNSLSLNESEVVTRFLYVVHHSSTSFTQCPPHVLEGSDGDGQGRVMGSQGREVMKNDGAGGGGELGFRLRFRPDLR